MMIIAVRISDRAHAGFLSTSTFLLWNGNMSHAAIRLTGAINFFPSVRAR
jgi:hypothetical protein